MNLKINLGDIEKVHIGARQSEVDDEIYFVTKILFYDQRNKKVQVGKDQEKAQSENRGGKKLN